MQTDTVQFVAGLIVVTSGTQRAVGNCVQRVKSVECQLAKPPAAGTAAAVHDE